MGCYVSQILQRTKRMTNRTYSLGKADSLNLKTVIKEHDNEATFIRLM